MEKADLARRLQVWADRVGKQHSMGAHSLADDLEAAVGFLRERPRPAPRTFVRQEPESEADDSQED